MEFKDSDLEETKVDQTESPQVFQTPTVSAVPLTPPPPPVIPQISETPQQNYVKDNTEPVKESFHIVYRKVKTDSFSKATEEILVLQDSNNNFLELDIDGTLVKNRIVQYPILCYLEQPIMEKQIGDSLETLISVFNEGNMCVGTNRDPKVKFPWASHKVIETVRGFLDKIRKEIPIYTTLNKQIPNIAQKERDLMVNQIFEYVKNNNVEGKLNMFRIQDSSFVSFDISVFPKEISRKLIKRVRNELGRDLSVSIIDYVIGK